MTKPTTPGASRARTFTEPAFLTLSWLLDEMVKSGLIAPLAKKELIELPPRKDGEKHHPLVVAAAQDWPDRRTPGRKLTVDALTQWLAHRVRLPYVRIDPLKLDVATITEVVSYAYASRNGILPIESGPSRVVLAVKDPFALDWVRELDAALKVPLERCAPTQSILIGILSNSTQSPAL